MDAFYASVEQRDDPRLRGRPVAVGGQPQSRGVVAAASYEARAFGVRSAMPMARALKLCPALAIVRPDFERYRAVSRQVMEILRSCTPLVEPLSLDEAYLDVTENRWGEPLASVVARRLKAAIREQTGLTASAGVAPNKFLAKVASGWRKPDGLTVIAPQRVERFLQALPVEALWGVGPVTARKLHAAGIERLVQVQNRVRERLGDQFAELEQRHKALLDKARAQAVDLPEIMALYRGIASAWMDAKRQQIEALNEASFSLEEYRWVRERAYRALGQPFVEIDVSKIIEDIKQGVTSVDTTSLKGALGADSKDPNASVVAKFKEFLEKNAALAALGL